LSKNDMYRKTSHRWRQFFSNIPVTVTDLALYDNALDKRSNLSLMRIAAAIPAGVTSLDLSHNRLAKIPTEVFARVLAAIPAGVRTLDLSYNHFGHKFYDNLKSIIDAIPPTITSLNLSGNHFYRYTVLELIAVFSAIGPGVHTLNLSANDFSRETVGELSLLLENIPHSVQTIELSLADLKDRSVMEWMLIFQKIPNTVTHLIMDEQSYSPPINFFISKIFPQASDLDLFIENYTLPELDQDGTLVFQTLNCDLDIDESTLFEIIKTLDKHPRALTDLVAGFLLERRIENKISAQQSANKYYLIQRQLMAMDFFRRAACLSQAEPVFSAQIEDMVFNIKFIAEQETTLFQKLSNYLFSRAKPFKEGTEDREDFIVNPLSLPPIDIEQLRMLAVSRRSSGFFREGRESSLPESEKPSKCAKHSN